MSKNPVSCHILFEGTVQGVGLRYTARHIAREFGLCGYVKNLASGDVEIELEGERSTIQEFIDRIKQDMQGYIRDTRIIWQEFRGRFSSFEVMF